MKLCKNCRHCRPETQPKACMGVAYTVEEIYTENALCMHPKNIKISLVTGIGEPIIAFAANQRHSNYAEGCGESGLWFEPKEPK